MAISETLQLVDEISSPANAAATAIDRLTASLRAAAAIKLDSGVAEQLAAITKAVEGEKAAAKMQVASHKAALASQSANEKAALASQSAAEKAALASQTAAEKAALATKTASEKAALASQSANEKAALAAQSAAQKAALASQQAAEKAAHTSNLTQQKAVNQAILSAQKASHDRDMVDKKAAIDADKQKLEVAKLETKEREKAAQIAANTAKTPAAPRAPAAKSGGGGGAGGGALETIFGGGGTMGSLLQQYAGMNAGAAGAYAAAAQMIAASAEKLAGAAMGLVAAGAKMAIHATSFKLNTLVGLKTILGSQEAAADAFKSIKKFADETPFENDFVTDIYKQLAAAGYKAAEIKDVMRGAFDVAALKNFSKESAEGIVRGLLKIKGVGKLTAESLEMISINSGSIVNVQSLAETLAKMKNITVQAAKDQITKGGKIDADTATKAILETIKNKVSGGELGKLSKELGEGSIQGLASTIAGMIPSLFENIDLKPVLAFMKQLVAILDPGSQVGKGLREGVESVYNGVIGMIFGAMSQGDVAKSVLTAVGGALKEIGAFIKDATPAVQGFVKGLMNGFKNMGPAVTGLFKAWKEVMSVFGGTGDMWEKVGRGIAYIITFMILVGEVFLMVTGTIATAVASIAAIIVSLIGYLDDAFAWLGEAGSTGGTDIGSAIVDGLIEGILFGLTGGVSAIVQVVRAIIAGAKGALDAHSPSRVFEEIGGWTSEGMALGITGGTGGVTGAVRRMAGAAAGAAAVSVPGAVGDAAAGAAANGNAAGGIHIEHLEIHANDAAGGKAAAEAFQREMANFNRRTGTQG